MQSVINFFKRFFGYKTPDLSHPRRLVYPEGRELYWDNGNFTSMQEFLNYLADNAGSDMICPVVDNRNCDDDSCDYISFNVAVCDKEGPFAVQILIPGEYEGGEDHASPNFSRAELEELLRCYEAGCDVRELWSQEGWYEV